MKSNFLTTASLYISFFFILCEPVSGGQSAAELTADLAAGKLKAAQICSNCHGMDGQASRGGNSAISPKITAQRKSFLVARLKKYKSGEIQHPQMSLVVKMLSDEDVNNVSEWYSRIKVESPWFSEERIASAMTGNIGDDQLSPELLAGRLKAIQVCSNCHGVNGQAGSAGNSSIVPNLTAQHKEHLTARLKDYQSGKIKHDQMSFIAKMLTPQDIDNVSAWYSSIEVTVIDPELELSSHNE